MNKYNVILKLLKACSKLYSNYSYEEARKKTEWHKSTAIEPRKRKERYAKELEEARTKESKEREKQQTTSNIFLVIGLVIFVGFIIFFS